MILALILALSVTALSGRMYKLDVIRGEAWLENIHEATATLMLLMNIVHIAGVLHASHQHHENLVKSMFNDEKRGPETGDIT